MINDGFDISLNNIRCPRPTTPLPLAEIRNEDGWRFIGIDKDGGEHYCIVRKGDSNSYYMSSNTITFQELIGWIPDTQAHNALN